MLRSISSDFNQGTIEVTGLDLDMAIQGEAFQMLEDFFRLLIPTQRKFIYTRAGAFEAT